MDTAGDRAQGTTRVASEKEFRNGKPITYAASAMRTQDVMARAERNEYVQTIRNRETSRYGQPLLSHLQKLLPEIMKDVTSEAVHETHFFPVFFACSKPLCMFGQPTRGEVSREASIFIGLLKMVALECVINSRLPNRSILVVCYLARVMTDLEAFFSFYLEWMCSWWHEVLFDNWTDCNYDYRHLKKSLSFQVCGPIRAKGKTADIVFLVGLLRQGNDFQYQGMIADDKLQGIHYTRPKRRLYSFVHDLTHNIVLPAGDAKGSVQLRKRAEEAGVTNAKHLAPDNPTAHASHVRKQLWFAALKQQSEKLWDEEWGVERSLVGEADRDIFNFYPDFTASFPFGRSPAYRKLLIRDLAELDEVWAVKKTFDEPEVWKKALRQSYQ